MALSTYSELQSSIADFTNRDDLTSSIPDFIALAEAQMQRDIEHWRMEKRSTADLTDRYTTVPNDFVRPLSVYVTGANAPLIPIGRQEMQQKRYSSNDASGRETYYSITGGEIEIFPTPSGGTLELNYVAKIEALSDTTTTNWMLSEAPDVYLYGSLSQTAPYLKDDERLIIWSTLYTNAVNALNMASQDAKWGMQGLKQRNRNG